MNRTIALLAATLALSPITQAKSEGYNEINTKDEQVILQYNIIGSTFPAYKPPIGAAAYVSGNNEWRSSPSASGVQTLGCRGTYGLNILQEYIANKNLAGLKEFVTRIQIHGYCIEIPSNTISMKVIQSTSGAVCVTIDKVTPLAANDHYLVAPCLWVRVAELTFYWQITYPMPMQMPIQRR